jgi:hypothetical protein
VTSTTINVASICAKSQREQQKQNYVTLDGYRTQLLKTGSDLNQKLNAAIADNAPDVGQLHAEHDAVLRELSDVQERILKNEAGTSSSAGSCAVLCKDDGTTTTTDGEIGVDVCFGPTQSSP